MSSFKAKLLSGTVVPALFGSGIALAGILTPPAPTQATPSAAAPALLPIAKTKPAGVRLAACKPCTPCAAKKAGCTPCKPCGAKKAACNPCKPCGAAGSSASSECVVPRLVTAAKANPCAAKKAGCNPCAAKKAGCNPCAAKKAGCNPCAAKKACNPCAAKKAGCNPCNPCGAAEVAEITPDEAKKAYECLLPEMKAAYAKAGVKEVKDFTGWLSVNAVPYQSETHGSRYVNNYPNAKAEDRYKKFEKAGKMSAGAVIAKDSFVVGNDGRVAVGPLFVMEKMAKGFNKESDDWRYTMVMPDGSLFGVTGGKASAEMKFCYECHMSVAEDQDSLMLVPEEWRRKF